MYCEGCRFYKPERVTDPWDGTESMVKMCQATPGDNCLAENDRLKVFPELSAKPPIDETVQWEELSATYPGTPSDEDLEQHS